MQVDRRHLVLAAPILLPGLAVHAQRADYPARPVRVLLGFPAGGTADIITRLMCDWLQMRLGQAFIVENRPGGATSLATEAALRATADGHTLLATTTSNLLNGALYPARPSDFLRDSAPVAAISTQPLVLEVNPSVTARSVPEFLAFAAARPGGVNIGNSGHGTVSHLAAVLLIQATGIDAVTVPYPGAAPMLADLLAGRIQAAMDNLPASMEHIRAGTLRPLAVTIPARVDQLPEVPALGDFVPGYSAFSVAGIAAPRGTPAAVIESLNAAINAGRADPRLSRRLVELGAVPHPGSAAEFARLISRETEKWARVITTSGIRME